MTRWVIVFDVDDTLYLERDYVRSGFQAVGAYLTSSVGLHGFVDVAWRMFEEGARGDTFDRALTELGIPHSDARVGELVRIYREHEPDIALLADAMRSLADITHAGHQIAVVTDGPPSSQCRKIEALGLTGIANPIIITAERGHGWTKPGRRAFEHVAGAHGNSSRYVYVADNPRKDFQGPAALGWCTYRVRRPRSLHVMLESGDDVRFERPDLTTLLYDLA